VVSVKTKTLQGGVIAQPEKKAVSLRGGKGGGGETRTRERTTKGHHDNDVSRRASPNQRGKLTANSRVPGEVTTIGVSGMKGYRWVSVGNLRKKKVHLEKSETQNGHPIEKRRQDRPKKQNGFGTTYCKSRSNHNKIRGGIQERDFGMDRGFP